MILKRIILLKLEMKILKLNSNLLNSNCKQNLMIIIKSGSNTNRVGFSKTGFFCKNIITEINH